jgi:hypothetical protein
MAARFTDAEIAGLLTEPKRLPADFRTRLRLLSKRGHKERDLELEGAAGNTFRLKLRQSDYNVLDFSVILAVFVPGSNELFRLKRYNGKSHEHTNQIEGDSFYAFHVHTATQRYQERGEDEDAYALPSTEYADLDAALRSMLNDCGFEVGEEPQLRLFEV